MGKKCIICDNGAQFAIRGTNDFYCRECAEESFGDISLLEKLSERKELPPFPDEDSDDVSVDEEEDGDYSDGPEDDEDPGSEEE